MKSVKYLMVVLFVLSSFAVYSQELESEDIDIFIAGAEIVTEKIEQLELTEKYNLLGADLVKKFEALWNDGADDEELNELKKTYQQFITYEISGEYESIFREAGWENNGHKKFFTILYGAACVHFYLWNSFTEDELAKRRSKAASIFGEQGLNIIDSRMDDLNALF